MITQQEYQARRRKLARRLPANSVALIPAASEVIRNGDGHYRFRQSSDFYYLTGFNEPEALLVINSSRPSGTSVLFNRPHNPSEEQWTGKRLGQADAPSYLGVDAAYSLEKLEETLPTLLSGKEAIYYPIAQNNDWDKRIVDAWQVVKHQARRGVKAPDAFYDLYPLLSELRLFKSKAEIKLMRQAASITVAAHKRAMRACKHLRTEYELEAELLYEMNRQGCRNVAYDSIVACGENACILHYTDNNQALKTGQLVLIDAGAEYHNYAADVTRVFPVNGRFTHEQALIYNLVLKAQKAGIACIRPGCPWDEMQTVMVNILTTGLVELGLLIGDTPDLIQKGAYKLFYMHGSGHWLGLDVHDGGLYKINEAWRWLEPGMVLTVEPGLYITPHTPGVDPKWWGIGVRIEDDILVTKDGHENLTADLMVEIQDIEAYMRG